MTDAVRIKPSIVDLRGKLISPGVIESEHIWGLAVYLSILSSSMVLKVRTFSLMVEACSAGRNSCPTNLQKGRSHGPSKGKRVCLSPIEFPLLILTSSLFRWAHDESAYAQFLQEKINILITY